MDGSECAEQQPITYPRQPPQENQTAISSSNCGESSLTSPIESSPTSPIESSPTSPIESSPTSPGDISVPDQTFHSVRNASFTTCKGGTDSFYSCVDTSVEGDQSDLERTVVASTPSKIHHNPKDAIFRSMESIEGVGFGEGSVSVVVSDAELSKTSSRGSVPDLNVANSNPRIFKTQSSVELLEDSGEENVIDEDPSSNLTERADSIDILPASSSINVIGSSEHITDHVDHVRARNSLSNDTTVSIRSSVSSIAILGTSSQSPDFTLPYSLQEGPGSAEDEAFDEMPDSSTVAEEEEGGVGILETSLELMTTSVETVQTEVSQEAMSVDTVISPSVSFDQKNNWKSEPYSNTTPGLDEGSFQDDEASKEQSSNIDYSDESKLPPSPNLLDEVSSPTSKIQNTLDQLSTNSLGTTNLESPLTEMVDEAILPPNSETENHLFDTVTPVDGSGTESLISETEDGATSNSTEESGNLEVQSTSSLQLSTETVIYTPIPEQYDVTVSQLPGNYEGCPSDAQQASSNQINISTSELKLSDKTKVSEEPAEKIVVTPSQSSEQATRVEQLTESSVMLEQTQISNSDLHDILQILPSRAGFVVSEISGQADAADLERKAPKDTHESEISEKLKAPVSEIPIQAVVASSEIQQDTLASEIQEQLDFDSQTEVISNQEDTLASEMTVQLDVDFQTEVISNQEDTLASEMTERLDVDSQTEVILNQEDTLAYEMTEQLDVDSQTVKVILNQEDTLASEMTVQLDVDSQTEVISNQEDTLASEMTERLDVDSQTEVILNQEDTLASEMTVRLDVDSQTEVILNQEDTLASEMTVQLDVDSQTEVISNQEDTLASEMTERLDVDYQTEVILNQEDTLASEMTERLDVDSQTEVISNQVDALASEMTERLDVDSQTEVISNQVDALTSEMTERLDVDSQTEVISNQEDTLASEMTVQLDVDSQTEVISNQEDTLASEMTERLDVDSQTEVISNQEDTLASEMTERLDVDSQTEVISNQEDTLASEMTERLDVDSQTEVISNQEDALASEMTDQVNPDIPVSEIQQSDIPASETQIQNQADITSAEIPNQVETASSEIMEQQALPSSKIQDYSNAASLDVQEQPDSESTIPEEETSPETSKQPQVSRCMYPNVVIKPSLQIAEGDIEALKMMDPVEYSSSVESTPSSELPPSISSREHTTSETYGDLSFESELTVHTDDTTVPLQGGRSSSLISGLSVPDSIHISEDHPASDLLISRLASVLPKDDVIYITTKQKYMLNKLECTNEKLKSCNQLSAAQYDKAAQNFKYYTRLLVEMRRDVDTAFKRIQSIKGKLAVTYPVIYERMNREVETDYTHPDEEDLADLATAHSSKDDSTKTYIINDDEISEVK
ncbi:mucin-2-like isoform X2 [Bolinopsis microptera]|uniref:mucin-2-like isoform X2 n=1 Tax=Bolinopsis microptera TaxID=2820187 RepID=UPI003079885B